MTEFPVRKTARFLFLVAMLPAICAGQTNAPSSDKPDAATLLRIVADKYKQTRTYRIEKIVESEFTSELSRQWDKSFINAAVAPDNRYRFEGRTYTGWSLKISDGKTEWTTEPASRMYTQKPAPASGPSQFKAPLLISQFGLSEAQSLLDDLASAPANVSAPAYLADEIIILSGKQVPCYVVTGSGKYRGGAKDIVSRLTYWIDKETHAIRKTHFHQEGALMMNAPHQHYVRDDTAIYPVIDFELAGGQDSVFTFVPPADAKLVDAFPNPMNPPRMQLVGTIAPEVKLQAADGKTVSLNALRGQPVLLDFWATWCPPCVDSMPSLEKLAKETSGKGLVVLSIDEDLDATIAVDFWTKRAEPWANLHDTDGEILRLFSSSGGVPEFVLIDASGKITFSQTGYTDSELRAAIAKLGPQFASISSKPEQ